MFRNKQLDRIEKKLDVAIRETRILSEFLTHYMSEKSVSPAKKKRVKLSEKEKKARKKAYMKERYQRNKGKIASKKK